jgi:glycosidase
MLLIHQFTYIGAPHIWNGDEVGMWGADDPDCRKPIVWADLQYEPETHHPFNMKRKTDKVEPDMNLFNFYKNIIKFRKENSVLVYGDLEYTLIDDNAICLAYSRFNEKEEIVVVFNKSEKEQNLNVQVQKNGSFSNAFDANETISTQNKTLTLKMPPMTAKIFKLK